MGRTVPALATRRRPTSGVPFTLDGLVIVTGLARTGVVSVAVDLAFRYPLALATARAVLRGLRPGTKPVVVRYAGTDVVRPAVERSSVEVPRRR